MISVLHLDIPYVLHYCIQFKYTLLMFNVNKIHMIYTHERAADVIQEKTKTIDNLYRFLVKLYWY